MDFTLGKMKNAAAQNAIILSKFPSKMKQKNQNASKEFPFRGTGPTKPGFGCRNNSKLSLATSRGTFQCWTSNRVSVHDFIESIFKRLGDDTEISKNASVFKDKSDMVREMLRACYRVDVSYLCPRFELDYLAKSSDITKPEAVSVLLMELIMSELFNKLQEFEAAGKTTLLSRISHPYLASRKYTQPDPLGPYYTDIIKRQRLLSTSTTRSGYGKSVTSFPSNSTNSVSLLGANVSLPKDINAGSSADVSTLEPRISKDVKLPTSKRIERRVETWRKSVRNSSAANDVDTDGNASKQKETQKKSTVDNPSRLNKKAIEINPKTQPKKDENENSGKEKSKTASKDKHGPKQTIRSAPAPNPATKNTADLNPMKKPKPPTTAPTTKRPVVKKPTQAPPKPRVAPIKPRLPKLPSLNQPVRPTNWVRPERKVEIFYHVIEPADSETKDEAEQKTTDPHVNPNAAKEDRMKENERAEDEKNKEEKKKDEQIPTSLHQALYTSMLSEEMPREMAAIKQHFDQSALCALDLNCLVDMLTVMDHVMMELDQGHEDEVKQFFENESHRTKVSQKTAGAVNNVLRAVECHTITDEKLKEMLEKCRHQRLTDVPVNLATLRSQLVESLLQAVDKVEEGAVTPKLFFENRDKILSTLFSPCQEPIKNKENEHSDELNISTIKSEVAQFDYNNEENDFPDDVSCGGEYDYAHASGDFASQEDHEETLAEDHGSPSNKKDLNDHGDKGAEDDESDKENDGGVEGDKLSRKSSSWSSVVSSSSTGSCVSNPKPRAAGARGSGRSTGTGYTSKSNSCHSNITSPQSRCGRSQSRSARTSPRSPGSSRSTHGDSCSEEDEPRPASSDLDLQGNVGQVEVENGADETACCELEKGSGQAPARPRQNTLGMDKVDRTLALICELPPPPTHFAEGDGYDKNVYEEDDYEEQFDDEQGDEENGEDSGDDEEDGDETGSSSSAISGDECVDNMDFGNDIGGGGDYYVVGGAETPADGTQTFTEDEERVASP